MKERNHHDNILHGPAAEACWWIDPQTGKPIDPTVQRKYKMKERTYYDNISHVRTSLADELRTAQDVCHGLAAEAGWWTDPQTGKPIDPNTPYLAAAKLMLCVTELAEACEGHRKNLPDDKLPHRSMLEVELADTIIRCLDLAGAMNLDVGGAIAEKLLFNSTREDHKLENRVKGGGKAY